MRIAVLSSSTATGVSRALSSKCREAGFPVEIYLGGYNQYSQLVLDQESELYRFNPDLVILSVDLMSIMGDRYLIPYEMDETGRRKWVDQTLAECKLLVETAESHSSAKILIHNFEVPRYSPLGILEQKQKFGFIESVQTLNAMLRDAFKENPRVFVFDYDGFCARIGKLRTMDPKMHYLADLNLALKHLDLLCEDYLAYIRPLLSATRKCIVLDLDNTLWGGVVGEEGLDGIQLGPTPEGRPYWDFQKLLLSLFNRGVILAINSRNNPGDVTEVFEQHPSMVLKEKHFASMQVNWNDKVSNLKSIAEELNIGVDSMVFIDDDPFNRDMVRKMLPEVLVVDLPEDPAAFPDTLMKLNVFDTIQLTKEDLRRGAMYVERREREEFRTTVKDLETFIKGLETVLTFEKASPSNIPRFSQLTQKTNQFNTTTRRYTEEQIKALAERGAVIGVKAKDKFGDNGVVGLMIAVPDRDRWRIDTMLLSCRVFGRNIEVEMLSHLLQRAEEAGARSVLGEFIPTKKNAPARDFYRGNGFRLVESDEDVELWEKSLP